MANYSETSCAAKRLGWNGSSWITKVKRLAIYLRDEFTCCYCGTDLPDADPQQINLDHIKPRSEGGSSCSTNLITACKQCNSGRGAKSIMQYATPGAIARIKRYRRRSLKKYLILSKAIIADKTGSVVEMER